MSYPVLIRPEAEDDIFSVVDHYDSIDEKLGNDVRAAIQECIDRIGHNPEMYSKLYGIIRPVLLRRFPYILSYVFEYDRVVVLGLVHASLPYHTWNRRN